MALVRIDPKALSFPKLHTFRCFGCGDVRSIKVVPAELLRY